MAPAEFSRAAADILARLVAFDTTSHKSNLAIIRYIAGYLEEHGIASTVLPDADGEKAGLVATIGPGGRAGIALSGHTDVVPVTGQSWNSDPFTLIHSGGRYYGRGTADMKGFIACALAMVPEFARRTLEVPVHLVFSYDEETGCLGVRPMIAAMGGRIPKPRMVVVGEPTSMRVVTAHKGPVRWHVEVKGRAAHSSMAHLGVNAITYASRLIAEIGRIERELADGPPDLRFDPPYATLQVTRLEGGTASNIIPVSCWFGFEVRAIPGLDVSEVERRIRAAAARELLPEMRQTAPESDIVLTRVSEVPPFLVRPEEEIVGLALRLAQQNGTHAVSYATEAGLFQDAGCAAVVCGPGDIAEAHTANEWIAASEIDKCLAFLTRLANWAEAPAAATQPR